MLLQQILQLPEKTWTPDADPVMATLTVVGQYKQGQWGFEQPIQLKDDSGVSSEVVCQSKYEKGLMAPAMIGTRARWRLKWFQGRKQIIVGYCLDKLDAPQQAPATAQPAASQPQQTTSQPAQRPQAAPPRDYDAENRGKIRTQFVKAAIISGQIIIGPNHMEDMNYWTEYVMTGVAPLPSAKQQASELLGNPSYEEPAF